MGCVLKLSNLKEKPLGQAIRNYYPKSFVLHQDVLFRVDGPGQALPGITKDEEGSRKIYKMLQKDGFEKKVWEKIMYELQLQGFDTSPIEGRISEDDEEGDELNVIVPSKIDLRLSSEINVGRCEKCGHLHYISHMNRNSQGLPYHQNCKVSNKSRYKQAPVFVPYPDDPANACKVGSADQIKVKTLIPSDINCFYLKGKGLCTHPKGDGNCVANNADQHSYLWMNTNFPLKGLKILNNNCPKGLENIPARNVTNFRSGQGYRYKKTFPDSGITRRLYTTVAWQDSDYERTNETMSSVNTQIQDVKTAWLNGDIVDFDETKFSRIIVIDLVYGIQVGGYSDHFLRGGAENNVLGRMLKTHGFVITLNEKIWDVAKNLKEYVVDNVADPDQERVLILAHTLKHAILNHVPTFTGMEETKFGGSYEILPDKKGAKIYLYDNEEGGHGGFSTLMSNANNFSRMFSSVYNKTLCPVRNCRLGCKHCLFIRNCGLGNRKINRRMLLESRILQKQV